MLNHRIVVLSSGFGSNLQAIIDQVHGINGFSIEAIISDKPSQSVQRGINHEINTIYLPCRHVMSKLEYDCKLANLVDLFKPDLIVLSGFMRVLTADFITHFVGRIINIHPSLLPKYKGLNTHQRVLESNDHEHGATVHYVTEELDAGEIIAQSTCQISGHETIDSLKEKVKVLEHQLYPKIIMDLLSKS